MKQIAIGSGMFATVDDEDFERINQFNWHPQKSRHTHYAIRAKFSNKKRSTERMHRLVMNVTDSNIQVDHINGDGLDNTKGNLRVCNTGQNRRNSKPNKSTSSIYKGVSKEASGKYLSQIQVNYKTKHLGRFDSETDAAEAYDAAAIKYFGEFAYLNFKNK